MKENLIPVKRIARYFTVGNFDEYTETIWFLLHGYGESAQDFMQKFIRLENSNTSLIAPEALSRFYVTGMFGKVGASWMTRECREHEIKSYINYLDDVFKMCTNGLDLSKVNVNVLGFSQGAPAAMRWIAKKHPDVNNIVLWSGGLPDEINYEEHTDYLKDKELYILLGSNDKMIDRAEVDKGIIKLKQSSIRFTLNMFNGKHEILETELLKLKHLLK